MYIYGESLERTWFDNNAFPNLTPELGALKNESLDFSHTAQLPGTDYTIAGMVASQCGIPLFAPFEVMPRPQCRASSRRTFASAIS